MTLPSLYLFLISLAAMLISGFTLLRNRLTARDTQTYYSQTSLLHRYTRWSLLRAGISPMRGKYIFWSLKLSSAISLGSVVNLTVLQPQTSVYSLFITIGFWLPDLFLWLRFKDRQYRIAVHLPVFCQFLSSYLHSGLNFREAMARSINLITQQQNPLYEEIQLVQVELALGREQSSTFKDLAARTGVKDLKRLALLLARNELTQLGLIQTIEVINDELARKAFELNEKEITKKSFSLMIPMALISLPLIMVVTLIPATLQILEVLSLMNGE